MARFTLVAGTFILILLTLAPGAVAHVLQGTIRRAEGNRESGVVEVDGSMRCDSHPPLPDGCGKAESAPVVFVSSEPGCEYAKRTLQGEERFVGDTEVQFSLAGGESSHPKDREPSWACLYGGELEQHSYVVGPLLSKVQIRWTGRITDPSHGKRNHQCHPVGSTILASGPRSQVYRLNRPLTLQSGFVIPSPVYGCLLDAGRRRLLNRPAPRSGKSPKLTSASVGVDEPIALGGAWVGYSERLFGADFSNLVIASANLQTGVVERCELGTGNVQKTPKVTDLVIRGNGDLGAIGIAALNLMSEKLIRAVITCVGGDRRILDSGRRIDPTSLSRHGRNLSWYRHGKKRSAHL